MLRVFFKRELKNKLMQIDCNKNPRADIFLLRLYKVFRNE
jgi:hypothetical protein